ncbi:hypothetical protein KA078_02090 [Candidatus Woesebacteria bacterium]|nr:hypothetical protein [Candidatus Woesebacteria bacterium]
MIQNQTTRVIALLISTALIIGIAITAIWFFVLNKKTSTGNSVIQQTARIQSTPDVSSADYIAKLDLARATVASIFISAEQYETEWNKYPSTLDEIVNVGIIKKDELTSQNGIVYAYEVSEDKSDCAIRTTIDTNPVLTNYCATFSETNEGVYALTPSEKQQAEENAKKIPYVAALSDVGIVFSAVDRYKAFNSAHPKSLQDLVDRDELRKEFLTKKRDGYTLTFSATNEKDCKVVVKFVTGETITSLCNDPDYGKQFQY